MATSLSTKKRRFSNIFSKIITVPWVWVATAVAMLVRSAGKAGQMPSSIFGIASPSSATTRSVLVGRHAQVVAVHLDADPQALEGEVDHPQVLGRARR